jgi:DNA ligase-1
MRSTLILILFFLLYLSSWLLIAEPSLTNTQIKKLAIQHGTNYKKVKDIEQYYVSEKLDGVRGYWDGQQLFSRQGNKINSPKWFTQNWPKQSVDGELWIERGKFQTLLSCVSKKVPQHNQLSSCWKKVRFMMFDLPSNQERFSNRVKIMRTLVTQVPSPYFDMVKQQQYTNMLAVEQQLTAVIDAQGEGLMLHLADAYYKTGRNAALMKFKRYQDGEAIVIAHTDGKGKYRGQLGAIIVRTIEGKTFKIGSGFSDEQRTSPPQIGAIVTYKYNGLTDRGIPRFARFWRTKLPQENK